MSSENNRPSNDPVELAIAAMKSATAADDRPPAALVRATIEALQRLDAGLEMGGSAEPSPPAAEVAQSATPAVLPSTADGRQKQLIRYRRLILGTAALAAVVLIAIVLRQPNPPPPIEEHRVDAIVAIEINPTPTFEQLDGELARAQADTIVLIDEARKRLANEQITRIIADDSRLVAPAQTN
ncbi:MAG TPA: hypothetical protein VKB78_12130 [Pirellulales bacterium]|nr:hypothetical protein [Pirellulales bacterium]